MPQGPGTYGSKVGRPPKKYKKGRKVASVSTSIPKKTWKERRADKNKPSDFRPGISSIEKLERPQFTPSPKKKRIKKPNLAKFQRQAVLKKAKTAKRRAIMREIEEEALRTKNRPGRPRLKEPLIAAKKVAAGIKRKVKEYAESNKQSGGKIKKYRNGGGILEQSRLPQPKISLREKFDRYKEKYKDEPHQSRVLSPAKRKHLADKMHMSVEQIDKRALRLLLKERKELLKERKQKGGKVNVTPKAGFKKPWERKKSRYITPHVGEDVKKYGKIEGRGARVNPLSGNVQKVRSVLDKARELKRETDIDLETKAIRVGKGEGENGYRMKRDATQNIEDMPVKSSTLSERIGDVPEYAVSDTMMDYADEFDIGEVTGASYTESPETREAALSDENIPRPLLNYAKGGKAKGGGLFNFPSSDARNRNKK
jgi:hypothetical protein